jgi:hypothetical protein
MYQLLEDLQLLYGAAPESAVNTPATTTAGFKTGLFNSFMPPIPRPDKLKSPEIGSGNEWGRKGRVGYWPPMDIPIGGWLNTEFAAVLAARCFGGTVTDELVATGVYDHTVALQTKAQGNVPKLTSILPLLGGYDFLHASCAVVEFSIEFGGNEPPRWSATLRNTGYSWKRAQDLSPAVVPPSVSDYHYVHPAGVKATYNDGSLRDLAADARLISGRCGLNNGDILVKGLPGDPFRTTGDRSSGAYARFITRGKRAFTPTLKVYMDETLAEWADARDNTDVTALTYLFSGDPVASTYNHEFEVKYPLSTMMVDGDTEDRNAAITLSYDTDRSDASGGIAVLRVRNGSATLA